MSQLNMSHSRLPLSRAPEKICILRLSALGDVSHTIPVVRALQKKWPSAEITWVCGKFEYKFLQLLEGIRFVVFDKKAGLKEYFRLWKALKGERFDVLLQMQVAARANIASLGIKSEIRLGWDKARCRDLHQLFINHQVAAVYQQHQVEGFLSFAEALGASASDVEWQLPLTENALAFAEQYIDATKPTMVISACSSHRLRNWQAERYAALADYAIEQYGLQVILSGGPSDIEREMAQDIVSHMKNDALNLVAKDTLEQLLGLLSKATVVVSPDSGPAHLANALGVPVMGLYACTWSRRSGPYSSLNYCVDEFEQAARVFLKTTADQLPWGSKIEKPGVMELIQLEDVKRKLDQLLNDQRKN